LNEKAAGALLLSAPAAFRMRSKILREGGELYDLRGRRRRAGFGALPVVAVARDRDRAVQFVELLAADPYGLLATPAEAVSPGQIPQRDDLAAAALLLLERDFDLLPFARGFEGTTRRHAAARKHHWQ
jgi:hypothetical protein